MAKKIVKKSISKKVISKSGSKKSVQKKTVKKNIATKKSKSSAPVKKSSNIKLNFKKIRQHLEEELEKLKSRIGSLKEDESMDELTNVGDITDAASQVEAGMLSRELHQSESEYMKQVQEAIKRIDDGTYGKCIKCGGKIESARLEALPYALICISCKRKEEHV